MKIHSQPMDLRDYLATAAMQGLISSNDHKDRAIIAEREKGTVESVDATKQKLIEAIERKHSNLHPNMYMAVDHLIFQLETGLPF
ncbi:MULTISPECIES: hypothetical protein [Acinetobacter calcoaceticus/baumannii complex]|uniref:hypothetical protein n=1 Tax=Acinetobacter calcoaceticus/baumannii complex TaxID=909768 RepID=UPI0004500038|nr:MULTISPECIES: hypothetical protein [Acinetobacter calcoaceticus/baumannii complex]AUT34487.1 hypothetical protein C2U64_11905 [Acinetobacter pittii]EXG31454.1 hypothetical protein J733_2051 [Acinetobacter sp. 263903-2]KRJ07142.1 hypothetical protein APC76_12565 [Acinetobacter pittii]MCE6395700.1 hypothetical protein [Acinetobacter pittii]OCY21831.1 hypothetical protein BFR64_09300 [Acinetobacter pittii]